MRAIAISTGHRFGRLTVIAAARIGPRAHLAWRCVCDCGREKIASAGQLRNGSIRSCGCLKSQRARETSTTHGLHRSAEYRTWAAIIQRCHNPKSTAFVYYGGRGIQVCARWRRCFTDFYSDVGPKPSPAHTLEREDNEKGYERGNVRWATMLEQSWNRRDNKLLTVGGVTKPVSWWARQTGLTHGCISARLRAGWPVEDAALRPTRKWLNEQRRILFPVEAR